MSEEQSLSQILRNAREQRGQTLEDVLDHTGLSPNVVRGLESEQFDVVEPVFMRMALRTYSEHLELDTAELVARFDLEESVVLSPVRNAPIAVSGRASRTRAAQGDRRTFRTLAIIMGVLAALLTVVALFFTSSKPGEGTAAGTTSPVARTQSPPLTQSSAQAAPVRWESISPATEQAAQTPEQTSRPSTSASASAAGPDAGDTASRAAPTQEPAAAPPAVIEVAAEQEAEPDVGDPTPAGTPAAGTDAAPALGATSQNQVATAAADDGVTASQTQAAAPTAAPTGDLGLATSSAPAELVAAAADSVLRLHVQAVDSTWLQVSGDGRVLFQGVVPKGERRTWQADEYLLVHSGRAHGLRYWFQNQLLSNGRLGQPTQVLRFRATRQGVALLDSDLQPLEPPLQPTVEQP